MGSVAVMYMYVGLSRQMRERAQTRGMNMVRQCVRGVVTAVGSVVSAVCGDCNCIANTGVVRRCVVPVEICAWGQSMFHSSHSWQCASCLVFRRRYYSLCILFLGSPTLLRHVHIWLAALLR